MKRAQDIVLSFLLWIVLLVIFAPLLPILLVVYLCKSFEKLIYKLEYNATCFAGEDLLWMLDNHKNRFITNALLILDGEIDTEMLREKVKVSLTDAMDEKGTRLYPKTMQHIIGGCLNYYWIDDNAFDIQDHVYLNTNIVIESKEELQRKVEELTQKDFMEENYKDLSPWELIILPYKENDTRKTAVVIRLSHALADGSSLAYYLLHQLSDGKINYAQEKKKLSEQQRKLMVLQGLVYLPLTYFRMMVLKSDKHALHSTDVTGKKYVAWTSAINLATIKQMKNVLDVTVSDVLIGCLGVSFNRYFLQTSHNPPNEILTLIPIDTRSSAEEANNFNNNIATLPFKIPTGITHTKEAIHETNKRTALFKQSGEIFSIKIGWSIASYFLPRFLAKFLIYNTVNKSSLITSLLIGPQENISIINHNVELVTFWPAQCANQGMGISICSYAGTVRLGIQTDEAVLKTPNEIAVIFETVANELMHLS